MNKDNLATYFKRISSFFARGGSIGRASDFREFIVNLSCFPLLFYWDGGHP